MPQEVDQEAAALPRKVGGGLNRGPPRQDYTTESEAPLLRVDGGCIICQGRSDKFADSRAVKLGRAPMDEGLNEAKRARRG